MHAAIDRSYAGRLERGEENPTVDLLEKVAAALGVEIAQLFRTPRKNESPPEPLPGGRKAKSR